ncbi:MAG: LysR family transcriptional regulator [Deltaproteobacteria bacterium]|nr:LysR family transcriptional regulator [Nannocystaceae bacterium]
MTLEQLEALIAVADRRSFSVAAKVLAVSKQTVSRRIGELEAELDLSLLNRSTRNVSVSDDGAAFLEHARAAVDALRDGVVKLRSRATEPVGELWVGAPALFARQFLGPLVQRFLLAHQKMRVILCALETADAFSLDHLDIAITIGPLPDLAAKRIVLGEASNGLFAAPAYLADHDEIDSPEALHDHTLLTYTRRRGPHEWQLRRADEQRSIAVRPRLESNDASCILDATIAGMGVTHLPMFLCVDAEREGRLTRVLPDWVVVAGQICALYRATRAPRVGLDWFLDAVRTELAEARPWNVGG